MTIKKKKIATKKMTKEEKLQARVKSLEFELQLSQNRIGNLESERTSSSRAWTSILTTTIITRCRSAEEKF